MNKGLLGLLCLSLLTACVTTTVYKDLRLVGSDKKTAKVEMGFDYDSSEEPIVNHELAMQDVVTQCQRWGYKWATLLSGMDYKCVEGTEDNCKRYKVIFTYQCLSSEDIKQYQEGNLDLLKFEKNNQNTPH